MFALLCLTHKRALTPLLWMRVLGSVFGCKLGFGKHFVPRQTSHAHTRTQTREMEQLCRQQGCQVVAFQAFVVTVL